jgi:hypothetical protein
MMFRQFLLLSLVFGIAVGASPLAYAKPHIIVVVGAEGEAQYGQVFSDWAAKWKEIAVQAGADITTIGVVGEASGTDPLSDHDKLQQTIAAISASDATSLWLVMIGHGTFLKDDAKFNLQGVDVSAKELDQWLKPVTKPLVLVNGASASGPFINQLSAKNRIVLTATKSGNEDNYSRFTGYFAQAMTSLEADLDHDDEVSLLEAFLMASNKTQSFYADEGRISTEHSLLDDNADGLGTPASMFEGVYAKSPKDTTKQADGRAAARTVLVPSKAALALSSDEASERARIESQLDDLRRQKAKLSDDEYLSRLEQLLVPLARIYHAAETRSVK